MKRIFFIIMLLFFSCKAFSQSVKYFSSDRDLSNSMITCILQDNNGFIWIATEDGLNRFDGLNFTTYRNIQGKPASLLSNYVRTLYVDQSSRLWVGCINGLMLYEPDLNSFREIPLFRDTIALQPHVTSIIESSTGELLVGTSGQGVITIKSGSEVGYADMELINQLSSEFIEVILEDFKGRIWIGTENEGVNLYDPSSGDISVFRHEYNNPLSISSNFITSIIEDYRRNIFIGTVNGGLNRYVEEKNAFEVVSLAAGNASRLPVKSLYSDNKNNLWVGTLGQGLWKFPASSGILEPQKITSTRFEMHKSKVHAITEDSEGNLWLGIFLKGVLMLPGKTNNFITISYQQFDERSIGSGCVMTIAGDQEQMIWVGTDTDGLYKIHHKTGQIQHFAIHPGQSKDAQVSVSSLIFDSEGLMWAGLTLDGLFVYDPDTGRRKIYRNHPLNENSLSNDKIQCLTEDNKGHIWIGTSGGGLNRYDKKSGQFKRYYDRRPYDYSTLCNNWVNTVFCDSEGLIWIGTYNRLSILNPETDSFTMLSKADGSLPNNIVYYITEDSQGMIWIGTNDGLARYDKKSRTSMFFTTENGLSNNVITAILEDNDQQLWISTHNGISCMSLADFSVRNYYVYDGLQGNEFRRNAAFKTSNGELFFGGINGLSWFLPERIIQDPYIPEVYLTELHLSNKNIQINEPIDDRVILKKAIDNTDSLVLPWKHKNFSIEFSSIGFGNPERITYQYRLAGFNDDWISTGTGNRRATYTNLGPGNYIFEVRATNNDHYSPVRQLPIFITPPWWSSWWFKLFYISAALLLVFAVLIYIRGRIKHRNKLIQLDHQEKITEAKLQFFTDISHEIRTPLTLIAGPLEKLIAENKNQQVDKSYQLMAKNTQRLMRLVNQLLDVRKIDRGQVLLNYTQTDLVQFLRGIMHAFDYLAEKKEIQYVFNSAVEKLPIWIDPNNFDKVVYNVISNAFKFTPNQGQIEINLRTGKNPDETSFLKEYAEITVSDTGPGIEPSHLERIFDRFYQDGEHNVEGSGTGIGLHLSRSLIKMQHGHIFARNRTKRSGSVFYIQIPLGHAHVANTQISHHGRNSLFTNHHDRAIQYIDAGAESEESFIIDNKTRRKTNYRILIVDDDKQMRSYLREELGDAFHILECLNGKEALDMVLNKKPDLVVSDVLMPVMDGISLCRKLKSNPATSHLPVLLLTSRAENEDLVQALDVGADAYFVKPFSIDMLKKNINNLLVNRERIKIKYSPGGNINVAQKNYPSADQALMDKIIHILETRLSDPKLNAEMLSSEVGMSRVHLYRRMKKITGQAPSDFIRKIRMQKASQLLEGNAGFIKEIAFQVGFTSLSYFSRCFHEYYGLKPSEYASKKVTNIQGKASNN